jgi:hypothetical protein
LGVVTGSAPVGLRGRGGPRRRGLVHLVDEEVHTVVDALIDVVAGRQAHRTLGEVQAGQAAGVIHGDDDLAAG